MKKLFLALFMLVSVATFAQTGSKSVLIKAGYQTEAKRFGLGAEGRYSFTENLRLAPDLTFFFPKNHVTGLDVNVNLHYVLPIQDGLSLYPLAGLNMTNNRFSYQGFSDSSTGFGLNLGFGASYDVASNGYLNAEMKYIFNDSDHKDNAVFMLGYGIRF